MLESFEGATTTFTVDRDDLFSNFVVFFCSFRCWFESRFGENKYSTLKINNRKLIDSQSMNIVGTSECNHFHLHMNFIFVLRYNVQIQYVELWKKNTSYVFFFVECDEKHSWVRISLNRQHSTPRLRYLLPSQIWIFCVPSIKCMCVWYPLRTAIMNGLDLRQKAFSNYNRTAEENTYLRPVCYIT